MWGRARPVPGPGALRSPGAGAATASRAACALLRSAYRRLWVVGRTLVHGDADLAAARRAMRGYSLTPLDGAGRPLPVHRPSRIVRRPRTAPVLTGLAFLDALTDALAENPPPARDRPELARLARVGIVPGHHPSQAGLPPATLDALVAGVRAEAGDLPVQARAMVLRGALASHGWYTPPAEIGSYGTDYLFRAELAIAGLGANTPPEAMYPIALSDDAGRLLERKPPLPPHLRARAGAPGPSVLVADRVRRQRLPRAQRHAALLRRRQPPAAAAPARRLDRRGDPAPAADRARRRLAPGAERRLPAQPAPLRAAAQRPDGRVRPPAIQRLD